MASSPCILVNLSPLMLGFVFVLLILLVLIQFIYLSFLLTLTFQSVHYFCLLSAQDGCSEHWTGRECMGIIQNAGLDWHENLKVVISISHLCFHLIRGYAVLEDTLTPCSSVWLFAYYHGNIVRLPCLDQGNTLSSADGGVYFNPWWFYPSNK